MQAGLFFVQSVISIQVECYSSRLQILYELKSIRIEFFPFLNYPGLMNLFSICGLLAALFLIDDVSSGPHTDAISTCDTDALKVAVGIRFQYRRRKMCCSRK